METRQRLGSLLKKSIFIGFRLHFCLHFPKTSEKDEARKASHCNCITLKHEVQSVQSEMADMIFLEVPQHISTRRTGDFDSFPVLPVCFSVYKTLTILCKCETYSPPQLPTMLFKLSAAKWVNNFGNMHVKDNISITKAVELK